MSDERRVPSSAEDEKFKAEARRADAEARRADAEAAKLAAEAEEALQKVRQERAKADVSQYGRDRELEKRERELLDFDRDRIYRFEESVTAKSVGRCVAELRYWNKVDPGCDIEIMFDSPGGSVFDGLALYDYIQELKRADPPHRVTTSTRGMAASMGGILLQAGNVRVMGAESWLLLHEVSTIVGGKIGEIDDEVELIKKIQGRILDIFAGRSKLSKATLGRRWKRKDWWIDSTEALKHGLVDEVR